MIEEKDYMVLESKIICNKCGSHFRLENDDGQMILRCTGSNECSEDLCNTPVVMWRDLADAVNSTSTIVDLHLDFLWEIIEHVEIDGYNIVVTMDEITGERKSQLLIKPNVSVAWALLRRPLQETLAYIEWLAVDSNDLIILMLKSKEAKEYDISRLKKSTIKENIAKLSGETSILPNEMNVYEFRYSQEYEYSINGILNGANHLVVNRSSSFKTSPSGLNFVFMDGNEFKNGIGLYYTALPYLLLYTGNIIMNMFADIAGLNDYTKIMNSYNLMLKSLKATNSLTLIEALDLIGVDVPIICTRCGKKMEGEKQIQKFAYNKVRCPRCFHSINTFSYSVRSKFSHGENVQFDMMANYMKFIVLDVIKGYMCAKESEVVDFK